MTPRFPARMAGHVMMSLIRARCVKIDTNLRNREGDMNKQRINTLLKLLNACYIHILKSLPPVPQNVVLFGSKVCAGVSKLR